MVAPFVENQNPADGAIGVAPDVSVVFDLVARGAAYSSLLVNLGQRWAEKVFFPDGLTTDFTVDSDYVPGTLEVWLDGVYTQVIESGSPDFELALGLPGAGTRMVARYIIDYVVASVDLFTIEVKVDGIVAFTAGAWQPGYSGTIVPIAYGYTFTIDVHPLFTPGVLVVMQAQAVSLGPTPLFGSSTWSFMPDIVAEIDDLGGLAFTRMGIGFAAVDSVIDVMVGGTPYRCYSGVSGKGDVVLATPTSVSFVTPPLPVGGPYGLKITQAGGGVFNFATVFQVRKHNWRPRVYALRRVFPAWWALGPRSTDSVDLQ